MSRRLAMASAVIFAALTLCGCANMYAAGDVGAQRHDNLTGVSAAPPRS